MKYVARMLLETNIKPSRPALNVHLNIYYVSSPYPSTED